MPSPSLFSHFSLTNLEEQSAASDEALLPNNNSTNASSNNSNAKKGGKNAKADKGAKAAQQQQQAVTQQQTNSLSRFALHSSDEAEIDEMSNNSLTEFYPEQAPAQNSPICIKNIEFSGWNPPPGNRALLGDLYYLEITLLEGRTVYITCWTGGFYINESDRMRFNPAPNSKNPAHSHYLSGLISQISPQFKRNFAQVLRGGQFGKHPFELMHVPVPLTPWCAPANDTHPYDKNRAEYSVLYTELDFSGTLRDWNEEYQSVRELPRGNVQERITRDQNIVRVHNEFVDAATKGAVMIVTGAITPINPMEPAERHMFLFNNIFYSFAYDTRDPKFRKTAANNAKVMSAEPVAAAVGEAAQQQDKPPVDVATYVSANNDLRAIRSANEADVTGLGTVLTTIVDYRGYRLVAQSIIPGVFVKEETNLVFGSLDKGKTITTSDEKFAELMRQLGQQVRMKEHTVVDAQGKSHKLSCPINAKGILGTDGRRYVVDLVRTTPLDANYLEVQEKNTYENDEHYAYAPNELVLRPEFVSMYCEALEVKAANEKEAKKRQEAVTEGGEEKLPPLEDAAQADAKDKAKDTEPAPEQQQQQQEEGHDGERTLPKTIFFNPNVLKKSKLINFEESSAGEIKEAEEALLGLAAFFKNTLLPRVAEELVTLVAGPVDGQTLTALLHRNGVNVRYLGELAKFCTSRASLIALIEQEMVTRVAKHEFNRLLRDKKIAAHATAHAISHFLNCLLGDARQATETNQKQPKQQLNTNKKKNKQQQQQQPKQKKAVPPGEIFSLTSNALWKTIQNLVKERFNYDLVITGPYTPPTCDLTVPPVDQSSETQSQDLPKSNARVKLQNLSTLRSFCLKVGVQIATRNYDFAQAEIFSRTDVLDVFPVVKHLQPKSQDGQALLEAGKVFLGQGRLDVAFELFTESLAIFHQVHGPMHADTANCYGNLALVHFHANDIAQALEHQRKMVIINERVLGLDHNDTSNSYGNLALFSRDLKDNLLSCSLKSMKRNRYLAELITVSPHHPDASTNLLHIGIMYQEIGRRELALKCLQDALKVTQYFFGPEDNLQTAQICHNLAMLYGEMDNFKEALNYEKRNYDTLARILGERDFRTNEANIWLRQFTVKGVRSEVEGKKAQRNITDRISEERIDNLAAAARGTVSQATLSSHNTGNSANPELGPTIHLKSRNTQAQRRPQGRNATSLRSGAALAAALGVRK